MSLKGKRLYHGTDRKIKEDRLRPSKSCRTIKGKKFCDRVPKVYTTSNDKIALIFASQVPSVHAVIRGDKVIYYLYKKDFDKLKSAGYIYEVEKKGFKKGPRTKYDEYVSKQSVKIIKKRFIPSVYKEIMRNKNIIVVLED
jgi:hypothetical protein